MNLLQECFPNLFIQKRAFFQFFQGQTFQVYMRDARQVEANSRIIGLLKKDLKVKLQPILYVNYFIFEPLSNSDTGVEFELQRFGEVSRVGVQRTPTNVVDSINHSLFPVPQPKSQGKKSSIVGIYLSILIFKKY